MNYTVKSAKCPECGAELKTPDDIKVGEILSCTECGLELEVKLIEGNRLDLEELFFEGEDWGE